MFVNEYQKDFDSNLARDEAIIADASKSTGLKRAARLRITKYTIQKSRLPNVLEYLNNLHIEKGGKNLLGVFVGLAIATIAFFKLPNPFKNNNPLSS